MKSRRKFLIAIGRSSIGIDNSAMQDKLFKLFALDSKCLLGSRWELNIIGRKMDKCAIVTGVLPVPYILNYSGKIKHYAQ